MKRFAYVIIFLFIAVSIHAQQKVLHDSLHIKGTLKSDYENFSKGGKVVLTGVSKFDKSTASISKGINMIASINHIQLAIPIRNAVLFELNPANKEEFWTWISIKNNMPGYYDSKGFHHRTRKGLIDEANDFLLEIPDLLYGDEYVCDYVHRIFTHIIPSSLIGERPEILSTEIIKSPAPASFMHPNGTLIITTGLLSTLDSEEELTAIMVAEVAHLLLDHQVINVAKEEARVRKAEFWGPIIAGIFEGIADAAMSAMTEDKNYYVPGAVFLGSTIASSIIIEQISERLGMGYNKKQIDQADGVALEYLRFSGIDPSALTSALTKIKNYYQTEKEYAALTKGDMKDLSYRIKNLNKKGEVKEFSNHIYHKTLSGVTTFNAIAHHNNRNFAATKRLVTQNIENNLAASDDYVLLVKSRMKLSDNPEEDEENLQIIEEAKELGLVPNLNLYKQEIIVLMRMNKQAKAANALKEYVQMLQYYQQNAPDGAEFDWAASEIYWANDLYQRINRL